MVTIWVYTLWLVFANGNIEKVETRAGETTHEECIELRDNQQVFLQKQLDDMPGHSKVIAFPCLFHLEKKKGE